MILKNFLDSSPLAGIIKLPSRVVIQRGRHSQRELRDIAAAGIYGPISPGEEICELEIGGQVVALGKIVTKGGESHFRILKLENTHKDNEEVV